MRLVSPRLLTALVVAVCLALPAQALADDGADRAETQLLVKFLPVTAQSTQQTALSGVDGDVVGSIPQLGYKIVRVPAGTQDAAAAELDSSPAVQTVTPDVPVQALDTIPTDPAWGDQWGWVNEHAPKAWDLTTGDPSVVVAVIDTGVDMTQQPDLTGSFVAGYDFWNNDSNPQDDAGHGTGVAGIIGARSNNGVYMSGWCPLCKIMPLKALGPNGGTTSTVAQSIVWATDHGADVINMSLGGGWDPAQTNAVSYAVSHGVVVVAAAGNNSSYTPSYPAADPGVVSVAATDPNDALYAFSNRGASWVKVAAPGCEFSVAMGGGWYPQNFCGTSAASPMVAGIAALARSYRPTATEAQIVSALEIGTTTKLPNDVQYGKVDAWEVMKALGPPAAAASPAVTGAAQLGRTLTASTGTFTGAALGLTYAYQWRRCDAAGASCADIAGATSSTYTAASADLGKTLRAVVTATNSAGTASATSAATPAVLNVATLDDTMTSTHRPLALVFSTSGGRAGATATVSGNDVPVTLWVADANGTKLGTASGSGTLSVTGLSLAAGSYTVYLGGGITTATTVHLTANYVQDASVAAPTNSVAPSVTGSIGVGSVLTASPGTWTGGPVYRYQWRACDSGGASCVDVAGATASTYTVQSGDGGKRLRVAVTGLNEAGSATATSGATVAVAAVGGPVAGTPGPAISGPAQLGRALTTTTGTFAGSGLSYAYQWRRCDAAGNSCADIPGATASTYTAVNADTGKTLRAVVTATNGGGSAGSTSAQTLAVLMVTTLDDTMTAVHRPLSIPFTTSGGRAGATVTFSGNDVGVRLWIVDGNGSQLASVTGTSGSLSLTGLNLSAGSYTFVFGGGVTTPTAVHLTGTYVP